MKEIVNKLSADCDAYVTRAAKQKPFPLYLMGGETPFLKSIAKKADRLGVKYEFIPYIADMRRPCVVDVETIKDPFWLTANADIDAVDKEDMPSCCSEAIGDTIKEIGAEGKNITIIGRGHAVQGLAKMLLYCNATVTVVHSKTNNLYEATRFADIIVVAAPVTPAQVAPLADKIVIDVSGTFKGFVDDKLYIGNIGKLTTSYILWRAVEAM